MRVGSETGALAPFTPSLDPQPPGSVLHIFLLFLQETVRVGSETRPKSMYVVWIVKVAEYIDID